MAQNSSKSAPFFERVKDWLYENGLEKGLADPALQKPVFLAAASVIGSLVWLQMSSGEAASYKAQILQEKDRDKIVADYKEVSLLREELLGDNAVPAGEDPKEWIQRIVSEMALESGLEVVSSENGGEKAASADLPLYLWKFIFKGSYHSLGKFMSKIENHKPSVYISNLEFARGTEFEPERGVFLEIKATLFVFQPKSEAVAVQEKK